MSKNEEPLGPPVFHDAAAPGENVLSDSEPKLVCQPGYEARLRPSSSGARINIAKQASPPQPFCVRLVWRLSELRFEPYTLRMRVRANPGYENIDPRFAKVPRKNLDPEAFQYGFAVLTEYLILREKVLRPLLANTGQRKRGRESQKCCTIDTHYENIQIKVQKIFKIIGIAA